MINSLSGYDNVTAAGLLARMALALDDAGNPAANDRLPEEKWLRNKVRTELYATLGLKLDDESLEAIEKFADALDTASDSLLGPLDMQEALASLSKKGELPSDLYHIRIMEQVEDLYGDKYPAEHELIEATVRGPDQEQHFGDPDPGDEGRHLISMFAKHFPDPFPYRSFTLLVLAQRQGTLLTVVHSWRLYADRVNFAGVSDLVDVARRFVDVYGKDILVNGEKGRFFLTATLTKNGSTETTIEVPSKYVLDSKGRRKEVTSAVTDIYCFQQSKPAGGIVASLLMAIDRLKYLASLSAHGW